MAKILDKFNDTHKKMASLRQKRDWIFTVLNGLEESFEEKKQKQLYKYAVGIDKKIAKLDKKYNPEEYNNEVIEQKIQKYDVKLYLQYRALNHGYSKKVFEAIKKGEDWQQFSNEQAKKYDELKAKREAYVSSLLKANKANNASEKEKFDAEKQSYEKAFSEKEASLDALYAQKIEKERVSLKAKLEKLEEKINIEKAKNTKEKELGEGVLLEVNGLKQYFGGLKAVDDLSFEVKKGEIFGLIGPNGAGKTTVFNCITRFYDATGGDMYFENKHGEVVNMRSFKVHDVILQGISRTFQNIELVKEVSVLDNLLIAGTRYYGSNLLVQMLHLPLLKKEEKVMTAKADKVLKYMDLYAYRDRLCWGLPYGILKRVEIARALMSDPKLIILDEPAAGLNEAETNELALLIDKIRKDFDCTILLVEHDMSLVMNVCDHICAISFGKKLAYGTPKEIQASKEVQEAYLGSGGE